MTDGRTDRQTDTNAISKSRVSIAFGIITFGMEKLEWWLYKNVKNV